MRNPERAVFASLFAIASITAASAPARAQSDIIRQPGEHPNYAVEIEPHFDLAWLPFAGYAGIGTDAGIGVGLRATIPIVKNGFIPTINNTWGIGFGGDIIYFGCGADGCPGFWTLYFPVVLQWNFYVAPRFSVFGEPGFSIDYAFYGDCMIANCKAGNNFFPGFIFEVGGRYHINEHLALTARVGYPTITFGVSFM
jgi:hypothetical protein